MNQLKSNPNPMQVMQTMFGDNPQFKRAMEVAQGKSPAEMQKTFMNFAQQCCCETNRNIEAVRAENYRNTCEITTAIHAEGEATRALINANVMQELRDQLQAAQLQLGNLSRTQDLVSQPRPVPIPAYITCSPYGNCACTTTTPTTPAA